MKASASQSAAGLIVAALALVALASGRAPPHAAPMQRAPAQHASAQALKSLRDGQQLDLNRAGVGDLVLLPGVGPKLAQRIVDDRSRRGSYRRVDELLEVKGIGRATLSRLSRFLTIMEPTTNRAAARR